MLPLPLLIILFPIVKILVKTFTGGVVAIIVYQLLKNVAQPQIENLISEIHQTVSQMSSVGGSAIEVINYLDFPSLLTIILTAYSACFSLKLMSVAVRAFGINTG
ncbi:DUF2523 domain-containing protein [Acinetobacter haemolyticus]|uniref:DUF2523 domain-containing protein n=1 Tax=Acinetobacter haemolyticus TaxID=29430 RepID=UPI0012986AFC|nr:DUF2523 domain-containing protein [Acinetobacter haemolyticus]MQZ29583.1 DUF2523 domain-containing protein [Acinetobacter haemolyticus]